MYKKSRMRETKHHSTNADSIIILFKRSNNIKTSSPLLCLQHLRLLPECLCPSACVQYPSAIGGWTKNTQKPDFLKKTEKIIQNAKTQKRLEICQN